MKARWKNSKTDKIVCGYWEYIWSGDYFTIYLPNVPTIFSSETRFTTKNDTPEWGDWERIKEDTTG